MVAFTRNTFNYNPRFILERAGMPHGIAVAIRSKAVWLAKAAEENARRAGDECPESAYMEVERKETQRLFEEWKQGLNIPSK